MPIKSTTLKPTPLEGGSPHFGKAGESSSEPPSSASSSSFWVTRLLQIGVVVLALGWAAYALLGGRIGLLMAARWPTLISKAGGSKVPGAAEYVAGRLFEGMWLLSLSWVVLLAGVLFWRYVVQRLASQTSFAWAAVGLFVLANLWCAGAGQTALFWLLLRGATVENQAQFRVKELLLKEVKDRPLLALVGSSQARAQFVEEEFNGALGASAWMMELHFPGSLAADVFFVSQRWEREKVDAFVFYVSPLSFYSANESAVGRDLLRLRDVPEMRALGTWRQLSPDTARYMVLGMALPLFQARPVIQHALLGYTSVKDVELPHVVKAEVRRAASTIQITPSSEYQKAAFLRFLERTKEKGQGVILVAGQFNPLQEAEMAPDVRPAYNAFLKECAVRYPHVTLVWQEELLVQSPEMYLDATHVSEETASLFTTAFCDWFLARQQELGPSFYLQKKAP